MYIHSTTTLHYTTTHERKKRGGGDRGRMMTKNFGIVFVERETRNQWNR
jgi:hypothetical protein